MFNDTRRSFFRRLMPALAGAIALTSASMLSPGHALAQGPTGARVAGFGQSTLSSSTAAANWNLTAGLTGGPLPPGTTCYIQWSLMVDGVFVVTDRTSIPFQAPGLTLNLSYPVTLVGSGIHQVVWKSNIYLEASNGSRAPVFPPSDGIWNIVGEFPVP